jgi:hypothetical protein
MAGLYFWGCALDLTVEGGSVGWDHAVQDVCWILDGLLDSLVPVGMKNKKGKNK